MKDVVCVVMYRFVGLEAKLLVVISLLVIGGFGSSSDLRNV